MRSEFFQERESVTKIYFKPAVEDWMSSPVRSAPVMTRTEMVSRAPARRLPIIGIGFAGVCVLIGITLGCMISGGSGSSAIAAPVTAQPAAARVGIAPAVLGPSATPIVVAPRPAHVNVRVESSPPGATVMRLEHGQTVIIGQTPIDMMVDAARPSDLILELDGYAPQTAHVDPATSPAVQATLVAISPVATAPRMSRARRR